MADSARKSAHLPPGVTTMSLPGLSLIPLSLSILWAMASSKGVMPFIGAG